ncbi:MAG TPA: PrsW family glutamic-type intramembrane protease [Candidatus Limnocylindrales bacterium]|nr:PrsW family glutamic-type intramembrane protease [Candidatus Limnocylindrales bacterium]
MILSPAALGVAAVMAVVPSLVYLVILNAVDRYEKEPWRILIASVGLGALAAPLFSVAILAALGREATLLPQFAPGPGQGDPLVAVVQELVKGALLLALTRWLRAEFDGVLDGIVYGAAVGAGFAAAESFVFAAGGVATLDGGTIMSLLVAGLDHAFYTAVVGGVAGAATRITDTRTRWLALAHGLATAALLHAAHDALPAVTARLFDQPDAALGLVTRVVAQLVNVLGVVTLAGVVWAAWRQEARVLREELREEVSAGIVSEDDYASIGSFRHRLARTRAAARSHGLAGVLTLRRLDAAEGELAFQKRRLAVRRAFRPPEARTDELRAQILRLRRRLEEGDR